MMAEFKAFLLKTNALALAVGVIIGAALGGVVNSLVNDIIMPPIRVLLGGVDFSALSIVLEEAAGDAPEVAIRYGAFLNTVIAFIVRAGPRAQGGADSGGLCRRRRSNARLTINRGPKGPGGGVHGRAPCSR